MRKSAKKEVAADLSTKDAAKKSKVKKQAAKDVCVPAASGNDSSVEVIIKKKTLGTAPEEYHFVLSDGRRLKSLFELADAVHDMNDDIFRSHVNDARNDFSSWVKDIFDEPHLAEELKGTGDRLRTEVSLLRYLLKEIKGSEKSKRGG
jgi:hypothetical protein